MTLVTYRGRLNPFSRTVEDCTIFIVTVSPFPDRDSTFPGRLLADFVPIIIDARGYHVSDIKISFGLSLFSTQNPDPEYFAPSKDSELL